ncbi:MAG: hypothetical protein CL676_04310 [Bdellovibrionaceae bacterium]|nr:hypothetical protein [Pseudobdellovibrionaceae bacterium]
MRKFLSSSLFSMAFLSAMSFAQEVSTNQTSVSKCRFTFVSVDEIKSGKISEPALKELGLAAHGALKTSYNFANKLDHYTLGLVSYMLTGGSYSLDQIEPNEWGKLKLSGRLVYAGSKLFSHQPIRGAKLIFKEDEKTLELHTGAHGEFQFLMSDLVPYSRVRVIPGLIYESGRKWVKSFKLPLQGHVNSKICQGDFKLMETPIRPILLIATPIDQGL